MRMVSLARLSDWELLARVERLARNERRATAELILHLGEVDVRRLYLEQGYASLFSYCTQKLHLSEQAAMNRIVAARAARRWPSILGRLDRGDLHLSAVRLLAPVLTPDNCEELLAAATHKSKRAIEELVARACPKPDAIAMVRRLPAPATDGTSTQMSGGASASATPALLLGGPITFAAVARAESSAAVPASETEVPAPTTGLRAPDPGTQTFAPPPAAIQSARITPTSPGRYRIQFTASADAYDHLCRARELLRHQIPSGDVAAVVAMALERLVRELEKRKFGRRDRPRRSGVTPARVAKPARAADRATAPEAAPGPAAANDPAIANNPAVAAETTIASAPSVVPEATVAPEPSFVAEAAVAPEPLTAAGRVPALALVASAQAALGQRRSRHVPAPVRRAVWERDGGRCTFTGPDGTRCNERAWIEFEHRWPHGDGGDATVENLCLLCRNHNLYEAQRYFGVWHADRAGPG